jgi:RimJ/RimL family protein N-acetyltransferase
VEIGWRLAAEYWGQGLATEGARALVRYGFETLFLQEIVSFTVPANRKSRRVMEKLGMTCNPADDFDHPRLWEGHPLRRHVLYRLRNHGRVQSANSERFSIRNATADDCRGILECLASAFAPFRESYTPDAFLDTVLTPDTVKKRLQEMVVLVALLDTGGVVGTIGCKVVHEFEGHLRGMAVRPEWQGSGVAAELLARAEEELRNAGCSAITLDTTEPLKRAMWFYEKHGFRATGRVGKFFGMPLLEYRKEIAFQNTRLLMGLGG